MEGGLQVFGGFMRPLNVCDKGPYHSYSTPPPDLRNSNIFGENRRGTMGVAR